MRRTKLTPKKSTPRKSSAGKKVIVAESNEPAKGGPEFREINNIVADTIERIYQEFGSSLDRVNCEDKAMLITKVLRHGATGEGRMQPPKLTEHSLTVPLCRSCRDA